MVTAEVVPAESGRYAATVLLVPGLWAGCRGWRGFGSYLAHRGWECHALTLGGIGGIAARAAGVAEYAAGLATRPVLVGHDAGAAVVLAAASAARPLAVVLMAPVLPARPGIRSIVTGWRSLLTVTLGRPLASPAEDVARAFWGDLSPTALAQVRDGGEAEEAAFVRDLLSGGSALPVSSAVPTLVVAGARDTFLPVEPARALAATLGADVQVLAGVGHWPHAGPGWQQTVGVVHRWLVRRLGEPLLELYAEAMADRDDDE